MEPEYATTVAETESKRKVPRNLATIVDIETKSLFGSKNYRLKSPGDAHQGDELIVLYGDNGSGKSTILRLVFHLLNPEPYNGHRSYVGSVPFLKISIRLSNDCVVSATRSDPFDLATYTLTVIDPEIESPLSWVWHQADKRPGDVDYLNLCECLKRQGLSLHFLQDSRRTERADKSGSSRRRRTVHDDVLLYADADEDSLDPNRLVRVAVDETLRWFQREVLAGTNEGQSSVNAVYSRLIDALVDTKITSHHLEESGPTSLETEIQRLVELETRNECYSVYGLTASLDTSQIRNRLVSVPQQMVSLISTVLQPYIQGHSARLEALKDIQLIVETFVTLLSEFFADKNVNVIVGESFEISSDSGRPIPVEALSSGEKHLLLLFCNAILARAHGTVLIIDEPEISLNIKWQRRLVGALRSCMKGVRCQLIIATHSFEILAGHDSFVRELISSDDNNEPELF